MKPFKTLMIILLGFTTLSCGSNNNKKKKYFSIKTEKNRTKYKLGETVEATIISEKEDLEIDSVAYYINAKRVGNTNNKQFSELLDNEKLGKHVLKANVFYAGNVETTTKKLTFLNNQSPKLFKYKIIAEYPHGKKAFTQGLEFLGDTLYESTKFFNLLGNPEKVLSMIIKLWKKQEVLLTIKAKKVGDCVIMELTFTKVTEQRKSGFSTLIHLPKKNLSRLLLIKV